MVTERSAPLRGFGGGGVGGVVGVIGVADVPGVVDCKRRNAGTILGRATLTN